MDVVESLFTRFVTWKYKKREEELITLASYSEDEAKSIQLLFNFIEPGKKVLLRQSSGLGFFYKESLYLPERISYFSDKELNRKVYLHKALVAGFIKKHNISYSRQIRNHKEKIYQIWLYQKVIQSELRKIVPNYDQFFKDLFEAIEQKKYSAEVSDKEFLTWVRGDHPLDFHKLSEVDENEVAEKISGLRSINSHRIKKDPQIILMLFCHLLGVEDKKSLSVDYKERKKSSKKDETEVEAKNVAQVEVVDLDKKKKEENPIMHSFETLHTADEYQGGYRVSDGGDDLEDHKDALNEVQMNSVTRSGGEASSVYKAYVEGLLDVFKVDYAIDKSKPSVLYPEWDYRQKTLKQNHCNLYLQNKKIKKEDSNSGEWKKNLVEKYSLELAGWKKKVDGIVNQEKWVNRQWEGCEIDISSYINFYSDTRHGQAKESPLYVRKKKQINETACLLLFDQSYSTDSWVNNKRVLDVELESIGLTGLLTDKFMPSVAVAGTWSQTRKQCHFNMYKDFNDSWSDFYLQAPHIDAMGYTRLGPAIRHSVEVLNSINVKKKILIVLTDGKPTDYDMYEGKYGIEDVGHAVKLARQNGIYTKALAIEKAAASYFPVIFGQGGYVILNDNKKFPEKLWEICLEAAL